MTDVARRTVDFLLAAMSTEVGDDGEMASFGAHGRTRRIGGIYVTNFFSLKRSITAALFVRQHGAPHLRDLSVDLVRDMLKDFIIEHYGLIADEVVFKKLEGSFAEHISEGARDRLATALAQTALFKPGRATALFPLVAVKVDDDFSVDAFFLRSPASLLAEFDPAIHRRIRPESFPPVAGWKYRTETPAAWLGIRSPLLETSKKRARAILGAIALTPSHTYRHLFSMRMIWGGHCLAEGGWPVSFGDAITPPMSEDIVISAADHGWLQCLADKLDSEARDDRRQLIALEYFYRAWPLGPSERFPILCMALDATFSKANRATAAVVDGVLATLGPLDTTRLRDLMEIRASVIHGGAPDVYESRKYAKYYRTYGDDPIRDMGLIVAACLRAKLFGDLLIEHNEPHHELLAQARASGQIPKAFKLNSILNPIATNGAALT